MMLESMTPVQMNEWLAFNSIEPFADSWLQTGIVSSTIHNELEVTRCSFGGKKNPDLHEPAMYVPTKSNTSPKKRRMSVEEMRRTAAMRAGLYDA